jgi:hypothetical protein
MQEMIDHLLTWSLVHATGTGAERYAAAAGIEGARLCQANC